MHAAPRAGRAGCCRVSYWVLVPEVGTDAVVTALRTSWLREPLPAQLHFCVANATASRDASLHRLPVQRTPSTPTSRDAFFGNGRLLDPIKREVYNSFLRRKVFAVLQAMSSLAVQGEFDYGVLLDADTALNVSNLELLARAIPGGGDAVVYTGRCQQAALSTNESSDVATAQNSGAGGATNWAGSASRRRARGGPHQRQEVARFIEMRRRYGTEVPWPANIPPSPGGGPGLVFSRGLLSAVHPQLGKCASLTEWRAMGDSIFSGGDSMLTRCLAELGVRCSTERDLRIDEPQRCPFAHGCAFAALFRKNPPWFYRAAGQHKRARRTVRQSQPAESLGLSSPLHETIAFHHVKPSSRTKGLGPDPRCAVRMRSDPNARAGWWGSSCLPNFILLGAQHAGVDGLFNTLRSHPEVVAPPFASLDLFAMRGRVQELLADLLASFKASAAAEQSSQPVASGAWVRLLRLYANYFPAIDPRDFRLTGEATPSYLYSAAAAAFFAHAHFRLARLVIVLREPASRTLSELAATPASVSRQELRAEVDATLPTAQELASRCGMATLYAACVPCVRSVNREAASTSAPCSRDPALVRLLMRSPTTWRALTQSWYHLFLPRWLALRPLVLFTEELRGTSRTAAGALHELATFVRLEPPTLDETKLLPSVDETSPLNVSAAAVAALRVLTADVATQVAAQLQPRRVPEAWRRVGSTVA
jgi:hypothetical protein